MDTLPMTASTTTSSLNLSIASSPGYVSSSTSTTTTSKTENIMGSSPESMGMAPALKPKQSKSRNGCVTCKAKRLKCDESKPTCHQCQKRGVPCGGYKKDFKWRPFEESALVGKAPKPQRKGNSNGVTKSKKSPPPPLVSSQVFSDSSFAASTGPPQRSPLDSCYGTPSPSPYQLQFPSLQQFPPHSQQPHNGFEIDSAFLSPQPSPSQIPSPPGTAPLLTPRSQPGAGLSPFISDTIPVFVDDRSNLASLSPELVQTPNSMHDLLGESIYLNSPNIQGNITIPTIIKEEVDDDEIEEIIRTNPNSQEGWLVRSPSPSAFSTHSSSSQSSHGDSFTSVHDIFRRPAFDFNSPEMLLLHFDKNTCGIMSVKDGPTENPWRMLIWPLATKSPALYHAIASMTAFHMSRDRPSLRVEGIEHMRQSATFLAQGFGSGTIRNDAALATTLVLAFSEAFDRHTSSGTEHLRGAKELVNQALTKYQTSESNPESRQMFTFLYNVWVYLDVLARLTSEDDDGTQAPLHPLHGPLSHTNQVDPLLGCAASLFPLIGRVASLVQKVRKAEKNSFPIISQAMEIKTQLENWVPEAYYEEPQDPLSEVGHCIKTAEAYQYATLLYLHQAVPELPSPTAHELAEKVMMAIATIPMKSRSCIVHIYPLLAAGCEAVGKEERDWVDSRWENMCSRMWIGNVDKAWEVVKEVWRRRDEFEMERQSQVLSPSGSRYGSPPLEVPDLGRNIGSESPEADDFYAWGSGAVSENSGVGPKRRTMTYSSPTRPRLRRVTKRSSTTALMGEYEEGEPEYEVTVRGKLHWISVMKDRNWEVLLG